MVATGIVYLGLSPALILGWGPLPRLGIAGAAVASVFSFGLGSLVLLAFLYSGRSLVRPAPARPGPPAGASSGRSCAWALPARSTRS